MSFVSIENARENLEKELAGTVFATGGAVDAATADEAFDRVKADARGEWNRLLGRIEVEGGTEEQKRVFYTALYHALIHPNVLNDFNGDYPIMESDSVGNIYAGRLHLPIRLLLQTATQCSPFGILTATCISL